MVPYGFGGVFRDYCFYGTDCNDITRSLLVNIQQSRSQKYKSLKERTIMRNRIIYPALCLMLSVVSSNAQKLYTLEECRTLALENSAKMKNSRFEVEAAKQTSKEAFTNYFPNVSAVGAIFKASEGMAQMDMALPVPGIPPLSMEMLKKGKTAGVTLVQPVFMGGRIVNGNKLANIGKQVSEYQLSLTEDQVEASVNQYYWQIVALKEKLRTLETLETQLK